MVFKYFKKKLTKLNTLLQGVFELIKRVVAIDRLYLYKYKGWCVQSKHRVDL